MASHVAACCNRSGKAGNPLQTRRGSRPHRSGYPKAEGVKLDKVIALEANRSADELALIVPGAPSYDSIARVSAFEPR